MFRFSRSAQITILAAAALGGILIGRLGIGMETAVLGILVVCTGLAIAARRLVFISLLVMLLAAGVWRGNETIFSKTPLGQRIGQKVTLVGQISDDPSRSLNNNTVLTIKNAELDGQNTRQSVRVTSPYKELKRGQKIQVTGKIGQNLGSVPVRMFSVVTVIDDRIGPLEKLRQRFFAAMHTSLPEPVAGFGLGLLVGVRALIDKPLQDTLTLVGLSHLVAVSGYNLTIIIRAVNKALKKISIFTATAVSLWLIFGFMLVAGFSASIVRAAFVSTLALIAGYYGHRVKPMTLIAIPAAATALYNPSYLTNDLGWQLSFLAFFGILVLAPLIRSRYGLGGGFLSQILIESLCAQVMTFPLIMLIFGKLSLVSPLANALIVPLVPLAMLLGFAAGLITLFMPALGAAAALPAAGLLGLMLAVTYWLAGFNHASLNIALDATVTLAIYTAIAVATFVMWRIARPARNV